VARAVVVRAVRNVLCRLVACWLTAERDVPNGDRASERAMDAVALA